MTMSRDPRRRGQSLVEFVVVLPVLLTLLGATIDLARLYPAWNSLTAATRDAAEYAATNDTTSAGATTDAQRLVCTEMQGVVGYVANSSPPPACTTPTVSVSGWSYNTSAPYTTKNPLASVTVTTTLPFRTVFPYPLFTQNGVWNLGATETYSVIQGR